ncbi:MAG: hypothetical protein WDN69_21715 [Aliidongia sp.]
MAGRKRDAARDEALGKSTQCEHFKGPAMDRQRAGLCDALDMPLQEGDLHLCQSQLAGEPQPDRPAADHDDVEFIAHDQHSVSGDRSCV